MKPIRLSEGVIPLGEFKTQAAQILKRLGEDRQPVLITQDGRPAGVLISPADYDNLHDQTRFLAELAEGVADAEAGRLHDLDEIEQILVADAGGHAGGR